MSWDARYQQTRQAINDFFEALETITPRPAILASLATGVSREYLNEMFGRYGMVPPPEACAWWEWANGSTAPGASGNSSLVVYGQPENFVLDPWFVLSVEQAVAELDSLNEVAQSLGLCDFEDFFPVLHYDAQPILAFRSSGELVLQDFILESPYGIKAWPSLPQMLSDFTTAVRIGAVEVDSFQGSSYAKLRFESLPYELKTTYFY